jgi:hypothetical protein
MVFAARSFQPRFGTPHSFPEFTELAEPGLGEGQSCLEPTLAGGGLGEAVSVDGKPQFEQFGGDGEHDVSP